MMNVENMQVINATVGKPVAWHACLGEPDTKVLAILRKRTEPASPVMLARLTGYTRHEVNSCLLRLKRRDLAERLGHGDWVSA